MREQCGAAEVEGLVFAGVGFMVFRLLSFSTDTLARNQRV